MTIQTTTTLNNGVEMPMLGLGVYAPSQQNEVQQAVEWALEAGCRLIDTASIYGNEREVAAAIAASGIPRREVFITTKVWNTDMGYEATFRAFDQSLAKLGTDYADLYLIHWPIREKRLDTWRALEKLYADERVRAIGVSNYYVPHLEELFTVANITPAVNQFELSPYCHPAETMAYCRQKGIQIEGYAPLVRGLKADDPRLQTIARQHGKSTFQVLVRWSLQHGAVTIPKSVKRDRIRDNFDVFDFELTPENMAEMNTWHDNTRIADDPMTLL
ncbi:aldo/keto reductase [Rudanella paleaurantiibacter]|uniref:Aldo/keto reductase n=1 Tax=Rudanella paleaurantiibacter TaxID=2614655 RepID=A0A7J5U280_9BACT|nr:aldo/keto reductase [Rudanella paleaurantiibacter]KAB7731810.1 aldo/keto reductase [Rudanella paleaurantiibacter]